MGVSEETGEIDRPGVEHDQLGPEALGRLDGFHRVLPSQVPLALLGGRELEEIRCGMVHPHRQRAKIVQGADLDHARFHGVDDSRHQADADTVAQFGVLETQISDFPQHIASVLVAARIPAGG
jgi:hypothetical protein